MILRNLEIVGDVGILDIFIDNKIISEITQSIDGNKSTDDAQLLFNNVIAFPGLINSHDHLDFNLFPQLGNKKYGNYVEWANYIHKNCKVEIKEVLKSPEHLRIQQGIYKNLFAGVTTVINHGKYLPVKSTLVKVLQPSKSLHSVQFEKGWRWKMNSVFNWEPIVMHIGEGVDQAASEEIQQLIGWNIFKKKIIGIHGVAMTEKQAGSFHALVWCPGSNYFLFDQTAPLHVLKNKTTVLFGSDSTLTSSWNIWNDIRLARETKMLTDTELLHALSINPAAIWKLLNHGEIKKNYVADIVIADKKNLQPMEAFFSVNPEDILMVIKEGNIKLFDERLLEQLVKSKFDINEFKKISIEGISKYVKIS